MGGVPLRKWILVSKMTKKVNFLIPKIKKSRKSEKFRHCVTNFYRIINENISFFPPEIKKSEDFHTRN